MRKIMSVMSRFVFVCSLPTLRHPRFQSLTWLCLDVLQASVPVCQVLQSVGHIIIFLGAAPSKNVARPERSEE